MSQMDTTGAALTTSSPRRLGGAALRTLIIGVISFLTLIDLFAAQAILPSLTRAYGVSPASIGFAVNASTMGMAVSGLAVAWLGQQIDRKTGIWVSLTLLAIPTSLLAVSPDLLTFTGLRIAQGVFMASAFTLTMAYLAEHCSAADAAGALAAYVTGNVASNLFGRLLSAAVADHLGLEGNFLVLALLNVTGAALVYISLTRTPAMVAKSGGDPSPLAAWTRHLHAPPLRASFGIGFFILFAFIGTFTYVNFVLSRSPIALSPMALGLVYFVFVPSILTTPFAGRVALRLGIRSTFWGALTVAGVGLPLLLLPTLWVVLVGLALVGIGTFFAQAIATGFVSRTAIRDRSAASGLYLASYYLGGLAGSALLGQIFERFDWAACVLVIGIALALAALLALRLQPSAASGEVG